MENKKCIAEFFGTFFLVLIGCGSTIVHNSVLVTSFCFGLTIMCLVYTLAHISGAHFNPMITLANLLTKKISLKLATAYVIFQFFGALSAALILRVVSIADFSTISNSIGENVFKDVDNHHYNLFVVFLLELIFSVFFTVVVLSTSSAKRINTSIIIGLALTLIHVIGIPITSVSINPARSIAPAIAAGGQALDQLWVFVSASLSGGAIGAGLWTFIEMTNEESRKFERLIENK